MKIYLLNHFTENDPNDFSSSLDIKGLEEADNITERLNQINIDIIYCSPFLKTIQSIYPFCKLNNLQINLDSTFTDTFYNHTNTKIDTRDYKNITNYFGYGYIMKIINTHYKPKIFLNNVLFKETEQDVKNRISPFLYNLNNDTGIKNKNILIVTHKNIIDIILKNKQINTNHQITIC